MVCPLLIYLINIYYLCLIVWHNCIDISDISMSTIYFCNIFEFSHILSPSINLEPPIRSPSRMPAASWIGSGSIRIDDHLGTLDAVGGQYFFLLNKRLFKL